MARETTIVGLDIGTTKIRAVVAQLNEEDKPSIIGVGVAPSSGIRRGVVVDVDDAVSSISASLEQAERMTGVPIEHAYVSIGGNHIVAQGSRGVIAVSRADGEISEDDVSRVINAAQAVSLPNNREIIHVIPRHFIVDGQEGIKDPVGMTGVRLEVEAHIIQGSSPYIKNLTKCVYQAGVDIDELVLSPIVAGRAVLAKRQKELGVVAVDIGGGMTGMVVYEEGDMLHTAILPVGGGHITNDIAIGLRTSIDVAEKVKIEFGSALPGEVSKKDVIDLSKIDRSEEETVSRHHIAEISEARLGEIFSMVDEELQKIDRSGLLPAGVVITGGGAKIPGIVDVAKKELKLPAQVGFPVELPGISDKTDDPSFATAIGLVLWGTETERKGGHSTFPRIQAVGSTIGKIKKWAKTFLP